MTGLLPDQVDTQKLRGLVARTRELVGDAPHECFETIGRTRALDTLQLAEDFVRAETMDYDTFVSARLYDFLDVDEQDQIAVACAVIRETISGGADLTDAIRHLDEVLDAQLQQVANELPRASGHSLGPKLSHLHYELADGLETLRVRDAANEAVLKARSGDATASSDDVHTQSIGLLASEIAPPTSTTVPVSIKAIEGLNENARAEAVRQIEGFGAELLSEASRLEAGTNARGTPHEVTASMVSDANTLLRRGLTKRRRSIKVIIARLVALGGSALLGVGATNLGTGPGQLAFAVGLIAAAIAISYELVNEP